MTHIKFLFLREDLTKPKAQMYCDMLTGDQTTNITICGQSEPQLLSNCGPNVKNSPNSFNQQNDPCSA